MIKDKRRLSQQLIRLHVCLLNEQAEIAGCRTVVLAHRGLVSMAREHLVDLTTPPGRPEQCELDEARRRLEDAVTAFSEAVDSFYTLIADQLYDCFADEVGEHRQYAARARSLLQLRPDMVVE